MSRPDFLENGMLALMVFVHGIMAGFFATYSFNVNLAMLQVDGPTYATVQSLFNQNVRHLLFFGFFFGGGALPVVTLAANWRHARRPAFWLIGAAGALYILGVIFFTSRVNLPLNAYTESWDSRALPGDWMETRAAWNAANGVRVLISVLSLALGLTALVMRASAGGGRDARDSAAALPTTA